MLKSWRAIPAGVTSIIAGPVGIGSDAIVSLMGDSVSQSGGIFGFEPCGFPTIILGIVAVVSGIFALRRQGWWLAVTGAIFAIPCMLVIGTLSIIFVTLLDQEFVSPSKSAADSE